MIGIPPTGTLKHLVIGGHFVKGPIVTTRDGTPVRLAGVGKNGEIIEIGDEVAIELWNVAVATFKNFMKGQGHLVVYMEPPTIK